SAYLWSAQTQTVSHTNHFYSTDGTAPTGYTSEGTTGYLDQNSSTGTAPLYRFLNSSTSHHYYSTANDPPAGFSLQATLGYLRTSSGSGLVALYRHYNSSTGDYLLTTASTPPSGYQLQVTLGYIYTTGTSGGSYQNLSYTYDGVGNITSITDTLWTGSRSFSYDALNRLTSATGNFGTNQALVTHNYRYDAIGNILEKAGVLYSYTNPLHPSAVTSTSDGKTYTYDANGNMLSGAGRTFAWDFDNRVDTVNSPNGSLVMAYDYTGIRVKKTGSSGTTLYPFSGYEISPTGTITKYLRIGIENVVSKKSTGDVLFYHNDHLGGVNIITSSLGIMAQTVEYDPWGKVSRDEGIGDSVRRFTGKQLDPESGLYYYGGRYYDPELGRFISPDPFVSEPGNPQILNRYSYVGNNPVNYIDPDGFKRKKKRGFFRRFFRIFQIIVGVVLVASGVGAPEGVGLIQVALGAQSIASGAQGLAKESGSGAPPGTTSPAGAGPPATGPPAGTASPTVIFPDASPPGVISGLPGGDFFSPALRLAAEGGCDSCPDSRLDLLRVLLGLFQAAEAEAFQIHDRDHGKRERKRAEDLRVKKDPKPVIKNAPPPPDPACITCYEPEIPQDKPCTAGLGGTVCLKGQPINQPPPQSILDRIGQSISELIQFFLPGGSPLEYE
ncbi:MAG: hypothetical protein HY694_06460, partial [Deltaproteobacteria bacterium]|nr:hypothetical protein [Deltaproteobacteria bacterium]